MLPSAGSSTRARAPRPTSNYLDTLEKGSRARGAKRRSRSCPDRLPAARVCACRFRARKTRLDRGTGVGYEGRRSFRKLEKGLEGSSPRGKGQVRMVDGAGGQGERVTVRSRVEPDGSAIVCRS